MSIRQSIGPSGTLSSKPSYKDAEGASSYPMGLVKRMTDCPIWTTCMNTFYYELHVTDSPDLNWCRHCNNKILRNGLKMIHSYL